MRQVLHGDVVAVARVLLANPADQRPALMARFLTRADWADQVRKDTGKAHVIWGDGNLQSVVSGCRRAAEPALNDKEYCACLILVFQALLNR